MKMEIICALFPFFPIFFSNQTTSCRKVLGILAMVGFSLNKHGKNKFSFDNDGLLELRKQE